VTTYVLIHGAFHGGWCWYKLAALLEARGAKVIAPDLPGHGRSAGQTATFQAYIDSVADLLRSQPEPVVLVGHSMGGAVITAAAEAAPEKVAKLIYLTAFIGPSGISMTGALSSQAAGDGLIPVSERALPALYSDCAKEDMMLARLCLTPQAAEPLLAPIVWTPERWGRIPRAFIGCTRDRIYSIADQRARFEALPGGGAFVELATGHSPFFSMPEALAETLEGLTR
jgi:pimeloyl-ACP methyl ester carboxylesterase